MVVADAVLASAAIGALSCFISTEQLLRTEAVATPHFGALVASLSVLYWVHAFIWNYPGQFAKLCRSPPLSLLGSTPVKVFAKVEILGKIQQLGSILAFWGTKNTASALASAAAGSAGSGLVLGLGFMALGQALNVATYAAIGDAGVYYGFKLGEVVPWCHGFPFNSGLRHPQYVGVALTTWGIALCLANEPSFVDTGLMHAATIVFPLFYVVMSWMEQVGDNDKKEA